MRATGIVFLVVGIAVLGIHADSYGAGKNPCRMLGYFKSEVKDRIRTYKCPIGTEETEVRNYAVQLVHTPGQFTAAYFYSEGARVPADGVTFGRSVFRVNRLLYDTPGLSNWRFAFMRDRLGNITFVDCRIPPSREYGEDRSLCRNK